MATTLADLIDEWLHYHPKLRGHFKVEKLATTDNPTMWPFDQAACIAMTCQIDKQLNAVATIADDSVMTHPNMIVAAEPNFFKMLEEWLITFHNSCYHQI